MAHNPSRPLSPHLTHYRWGPHMAVSILHRATGDAMGIAGTLLLLWWLGALASGPDAYAKFVDCVRGPLGTGFLIALTWAFFQHLSSGIRHLVLDTGAGYALPVNRRYSILVLMSGVVCTALLWSYICWGKG